MHIPTEHFEHIPVLYTQSESRISNQWFGLCCSRSVSLWFSYNYTCDLTYLIFNIFWIFWTLDWVYQSNREVCTLQVVQVQHWEISLQADFVDRELMLLFAAFLTCRTKHPRSCLPWFSIHCLHNIKKSTFFLLPVHIAICPSLWHSGVGSRLGRNRLWVRFLAVSDIYPHVQWAYNYLGPFGVLWVHMADTKIVLKKSRNWNFFSSLSCPYNSCQLYLLFYYQIFTYYHHRKIYKPYKIDTQTNYSVHIL